MGNIIDRGPSLVFVKDLDGHIFGGFASTSWTIGPQFKGDDMLIEFLLHVLKLMTRNASFSTIKIKNILNLHNLGTTENFLFSLAPEMAIYNTTGYNDHYQYINIQQQTFPNGMVFCLNFFLLFDASVSDILFNFLQIGNGWSVGLLWYLDRL